jgi:hypothetical protein
MLGPSNGQYVPYVSSGALVLAYNGPPYPFELDGAGHLIDPSTGLSAYVGSDTTVRVGSNNTIYFETAETAAANVATLLICSVTANTQAFTCYTAADSTANVFYEPFLSQNMDLGTLAESRGYNSQVLYPFILPAC